MAWNGSNNKVEVGGREGNGKRHHSTLNAQHSTLRHGLLAGAIVVALGGAAVWWFVGRPGTSAPNNGRDGARPSPIAEVKPAAVMTNKVVETKPKPIDPKARPTKVGEELNGYVMLPSGRIHRRVGVVTNSIAARAKGKYAIFERSCNNEIACYLTLKPGDIIFGSRKSDGSFKHDFIESLKEPIVVSHEDTPEVAQLKRDVIAARLELKDAMDRGEDIEQIMTDTRQELQDMMRLKLEYKKMFNEQRKACETDADVEDLLTACNKILEQKGCSPLSYGPITRRNMMRERANENFSEFNNTEN